VAKPIVNIKFLADLKQFSTQMQNVDRRLQKVSKKFQKVGTTLSVGLTAPITALGTLAVKTFADFEQEMAKVQAISGATTKQFSALEKNAKQLGATTRFTASEVAGLQLNFSKLGLNPDEILNATEATLNLALATGEDLAQSATVAASTLKQFGLDAAEAGRVTDVMAKSFSSSALDLTKFETAMAAVGPVANSAGISLEQTAGYMAVLANAGLDASTVGTGLRNVFLDLAKKGLTFEEAMAQINASTNKNATSMALFGKRGATVGTVLAANTAQAGDFTKQFEAAGGSAAAMAEIMDNTLQGSLFRLKSAVEGTLISFGEQLAPVISKVADFFGDLAGKITNLSPGMKKLLVIVGGVAAAVGPLLALAGTILPAIATGFSILAGPVGIIVAGLTAIGVIIYKNWKPIKQTLVDIANYFVDLYNESMAFRVMAESIIVTFQNIYRVGQFVFATLGNIFDLLVDQIKTGFSNLGDIIKAIFTGNFDELPNLLAQSVQDSFGNLKSFVDKSSQEFSDLATDITANISGGIDRAINGRQYKISPDVVDADAVQNKVAQAVQKGSQGETADGATETGPGGPRKATSINEGFGLRQIRGVGIDQGVENNIIPIAQFTEGEERLAQFRAKLNEFNEGSAAILENVAGNFAQGFADVVAGIATGAVGFGAVGGLLLKTFADLAQQIGKAAIKIGVTMKAVKLSFKSPLAAIAAGTGLLVVAGIMRSLAGRFSGGGGQNVPGFADGGIVGGSSFYGDQILARVNSGELILNMAQQRNLASHLKQGRPVINLLPSLQFDGRNLGITLDQVDEFQKRIG
jgi:hypothetical protein